MRALVSGKRHCHGLEQFGLEDIVDAGRRADGHQAGAYPKRRLRGECGRAGFAHRARKNSRMTIGTFVGGGCTWRQSRFDEIFA